MDSSIHAFIQQYLLATEYVLGSVQNIRDAVMNMIDNEGDIERGGWKGQVNKYINKKISQ